MRVFVMLLATAGPLVACQTYSAPEDEPAVLVEPTAETRAELLLVVMNALGTPVVLAADALTTTSLLTIEPNPPRTLSGRPGDGRRLDRPEQFRLVVSAMGCELVRLSNGDRFELHDANCVPE